MFSENQSGVDGDGGQTTSSSTRGFYSFQRGKRHDIDIPELRGRRCWGTNSGWIVAVGSDLETHLVNPLTRVRIPLPSISTFGEDPEYLDPRFDIHKAIVVRRSPEDVVVFAIHGEGFRLAFARPGYESWIPVEDDESHFDDVARFGHQIFGLRMDGSLGLCKIDGPHPPKVIDFAPPPGDGTGVVNKIFADASTTL